MIGVLIPVHNEEQSLRECLLSIMRAAEHPELAGEEVRIVAVLDHCEDNSLAIVESLNICSMSIEARNVGQARLFGTEYLLECGARWIACTDADSRVAEDWLAAQLALEADMVCGIVELDAPDTLPKEVQQLYRQLYKAEDGHHHIHGANLGFCAHAYRASGGFRPAPAHEDVYLVRRFEKMGARIAWSCKPRVITSSRLVGKAREGLADYLQSLIRMVDKMK